MVLNAQIDPIAAEVGFDLKKQVVVAPLSHLANVFFEPNDPLLLQTSSTAYADPAGSTRVELTPQRRGLLVLVARVLGTTGPILTYQEVVEFTLDDGAARSAQVSLQNNMGVATITMRPFIPNLPVVFNMFAHTATFPGGVNRLSFNTSDLDAQGNPIFEQIFDDVTGEIVGVHTIEMEIPANEGMYCFNVSIYQPGSVTERAADTTSVNGLVRKFDEPYEALKRGVEIQGAGSLFLYNTASLPSDPLHALSPPPGSAGAGGREAYTAKVRAAASSRAAATKYELKVLHGHGSGRYEAGTVVTVTAAPDTTHNEFADWTGPVADPTTAQTTVTMPANDVAVDAEFDKKYKLTVTGGTGDGYYLNNTVVPIGPDSVQNANKVVGYWTYPGTAQDRNLYFKYTTANKNTKVKTVSAAGKYLAIMGGTIPGALGYFAPGVLLPVAANAPDPGFIIAGWLAETQDNPAGLAVSISPFVMPESNTGLIASLQRVGYILTVPNGNGGGIYAVNDLVTVSWTNWDRYTFNGWFVGIDITASSTALTYTFNMPPNDLVVTASQGSGVAIVSIDDAGVSSSNAYSPGTMITLDAIPQPGMIFVGWTGSYPGTGIAFDPNSIPNATQQDTNYTTVGLPTALTPQWRLPHLTVLNGADSINGVGSNGIGSGDFLGGTRTSVSCGLPDPNYVFAVWTGAAVEDSNSPRTFLTMPIPAADVTVTASFASGNGEVTVVLPDGSGSGNYVIGQSVPITADPPLTNWIFDHWTGTGIANPLSAMTTLVVQDTNGYPCHQ